MTPILNNLLALTLWLLGLSICVDFISLDKRQREWAKKHPGTTYIRRYRRLVCQAR